MKRSLVGIMFLICCGFIHGGELKVLNYNIWNGFEFGKSIEKREAFINFMNHHDVDVAALQELCDFNQQKLEKLALEYGHPYAIILKSSGYPVGLTSKKPIIVKKKQLSGFWHGFLHCQSGGVDYIVVHLSPAEATFRQKEMKKLAKYIKKKRLITKKLILLGDFNSHSPLDAEILEKRNEVLENYSSANLSENKYDFSVIQGFFDIQLVDALYLYNSDIVNGWSFPAEALVPDQTHFKRGERIDYQLISPFFVDKIKGGDIVIDSFSRIVSDHYPVIVTYSYQ